MNKHTKGPSISNANKKKLKINIATCSTVVSMFFFLQIRTNNTEMKPLQSIHLFLHISQGN